MQFAVDSPVKSSLITSCKSPYRSIKKSSDNVLGETAFPAFFPSSPLPLGKKRSIDNTIGSPSRSASKYLCGGRPIEVQGVEDRFIPNRARLDEDLAYYTIMNSAENDQPNPPTPSKPHTPAQLRLSKELSNLTAAGGDKRILECRKSISPMPDRSSSSKGVFARRDSLEPAVAINKSIIRSIPSQPKKILDVPNLINDYYLNPLHWGSQNALAVALGNTVYVWHADTGQVDSVLTIEEPDAYIGGVQWSPTSAYLCVGSSLHSVYVYDVKTESIHREMEGHTNRVVSVAWQSEHVVCTGGRDCSILTHDIRARRSLVASYMAHTHEVCGLAWSPDSTLLASGGNDNLLCIWDARQGSSTHTAQGEGQGPLHKLESHLAAVKAVAWCPWQRGVLASGGGTHDRTIKIWTANTGSLLKSADTGSQVCALQWSDSQHKELVSSHGFSDNQLIVWKYSDMSRIQELRGHTQRVLCLAKSPDQRTICSASPDETLRFWDVWDGNGVDAGSLSPIGSPVRTSGKGLSPKPTLLNMSKSSMLIR